MNVIDGKYVFIAVNPCTGNFHTEKEGVVFLAKDAAFVEMVQAYPEICRRMGADDGQIEGAERLVQRINTYAVKNGSKVPDVSNDCELDHVMNPGEQE